MEVIFSIWELLLYGFILFALSFSIGVVTFTMLTGVKLNDLYDQINDLSAENAKLEESRDRWRDKYWNRINKDR